MTSYHHGNLQDTLLATTLEMLAEDGAEAVSLRAVARRAGVSAMAPYRHYPDKNALLAAAAIVGFEKLRQLFDEADTQAALGDELQAYAVAYVSFAVQNPALFRLMFASSLAGDHPSLAEASEAAYETFRQKIRKFAAPGRDIEGCLIGYWSLMHGLAALTLDGKLVGKNLGEPVEIARRVTRALFPAERDQI